MANAVQRGEFAEVIDEWRCASYYCEDLMHQRSLFQAITCFGCPKQRFLYRLPVLETEPASPWELRKLIYI